ncbi:SLBB domain-containing protein [Sediminibacterium ginsengisoli]|uniref:Protein involved in polysaccharide export, contains SLBB domain of the beta-grasp fold n=1 Tax=Sediminibacterium ginsengisoli TaxID=413434 RepID=A0A1T4N410_9BACT|nr:SLBB domain-containing protein [Sediminibacterium ginsengisoli]SJZ73856.1 protein involved in polysaccharide export, contains SLBB domain of the beta-grasp fold [Sediminibacterium ginsengisoli]
MTVLKTRRSLLFLLLACCICAVSFAQNAGSVSQYSDQQIMALWKQAQKAGMSEADAVKALAQRGMSSKDINAFKKRLVSLQGNASSRSLFDSKNLIKDTTAFIRDTTWVYEVPTLKKGVPYYGFDFFNGSTSSFSPNFNLPTPANYVLGPNDELTVTLTGFNELTNTSLISREGNYEVPHAGVVKLSGLTIQQATQKIKSKLQQPYPAVASGKTQVMVQLGELRSIHVTVIGEAQNPGGYTISALSSFFNALYLSGGPSTNGSLRKIELIRNNKLVETIDFYAFLQKGTLKDIRLEDQDVIRFPLYEKRVILDGEVKRPAVYELLEKETLAELLQYGGGFDPEAFKDGVKVVQLGEKERNVRDVAAADYNYFIPRNGDSVHVEKILARYTNRVIISGAVQRPGNYELTKDLTLAQLIRKAEGLRVDAFLNRGYIKRMRNDNAEREFQAFDVNAVLSGTAAPIYLQREDSVVIAGKDSLRDIPHITVAGNVRNPAVFEYRKGMSLEDVIFMAGGFTSDAANHKVEISRLEKNTADTLANKLLDIITVNVDSSLQNANKTMLQPFDYIFVPKLLNYHSLGNVKLRGEVLYAGDYALEKRDESVQEIIARAGGLSPFASMNDVQVYRNNLRVATNLLGDQARSGKPAARFLLLPGDSIYIPRNVPFVEVKGAVFNPQILSYESGSFLSYISNAGGVTDQGNLKKAYIQYSNGINQKIKHFLFFRKYPKVTAGSKIIVPEKTESTRKGLSILELSALTGTLSAVVSMIAVLK